MLVITDVYFLPKRANPSFGYIGRFFLEVYYLFLSTVF